MVNSVNMSKSERAIKSSKYDEFITKYGNSMNFNDARLLLEEEDITPPLEEIYKARIWHDRIKNGGRQPK